VRGSDRSHVKPNLLPVTAGFIIWANMPVHLSAVHDLVFETGIMTKHFFLCFIFCLLSKSAGWATQ
jgi:hypothetical protein